MAPAIVVGKLEQVFTPTGRLIAFAQSSLKGGVATGSTMQISNAEPAYAVGAVPEEEYTLIK